MRSCVEQADGGHLADDLLDQPVLTAQNKPSRSRSPFLYEDEPLNFLSADQSRRARTLREVVPEMSL